jgi:hypothetical protein
MISIIPIASITGLLEPFSGLLLFNAGEDLQIRILNSLFIFLHYQSLYIYILLLGVKIMLIGTTLHVHKTILEKLNKSAIVIGISRNSIIKLLIQRVMKDNQQMIKANSRVRYQEKDLKENWNRINIVFNEYEYEYCLDLRKFLKMSVSLILAYAVLRYLDEISRMGGSTNNYCLCNYVFTQKTIDNVICWQIYWGIPQLILVL